MAIPDKPDWFEPRTLYLRRPRGMRCGRRPGPGGSTWSTRCGVGTPAEIGGRSTF
jgi:hypothetical protein